MVEAEELVLIELQLDTPPAVATAAPGEAVTVPLPVAQLALLALEIVTVVEAVETILP
jgi:hypothetical protein